MDSKKAAIYARVSSEKQDTDLSISAQLRALREFAANKSYEVIREFVDEAESGRTADRPAFKEMISIARRSSSPFNVILVWKYSRFARNREDSIVYKTLLRKHGVQVISITEPFEDTPTGRLLEAMIESLDEFYSANLGEEIMRGLRESVSRGFWVNGYAPYGYRRIKVRDGNKDRVKLEPEEHQSEVVKRLFSDVLKGKGLKELGKELQANGIASPTGKSWGKTTLYHILTNEVYTGTSVWGRVSQNPKITPVRCENAFPALVSRNDFNLVQNLLKERASAQYYPRRTSSKFLLSGLAHCGECGKALVGQDAKNGKFSYYVCGTLMKRGAGTCRAKYLNAPKFEGVVIEEIKR
jgi:site-specific DNA recombinase